MRVTPIVKRVLRDKERTRNSDKELLLACWEEMGFYLSESQRAKFREMPSTETIRRIRQKIQQGGEYMAKDKIKHEREIKSQEMQQNSPSAKPERLELLLEDEPKAISWLHD